MTAKPNCAGYLLNANLVLDVAVPIAVSISNCAPFTLKTSSTAAN
jgi:hypothetical protein